MQARTFAFDAGRGRVTVRFATRPPARCQLRLSVAGGVVVGLTDRGAVTLSGRVDDGTSRIDVACASRRASYDLEIERSASGG